MSEVWEGNLKKETMLVSQLKERKEKSEVTTFTEEAQEKLSDLYEDDLVLVKSLYEKGKGFTVKKIQLYEEVVGENDGL